MWRMGIGGGEGWGRRGGVGGTHPTNGRAQRIPKIVTPEIEQLLLAYQILEAPNRAFSEKRLFVTSI